MIRLLVDSPDPGTAVFLRGRLDTWRFCIVGAGPEADFMELIRRVRPQIAVVDHVHERPDIARARIAALKEFCPGVRVIAVSENPSARDGQIVEEGVFYYLTLAVGDELVRVIEAGARILQAKAEERRAES